MKFVALLLLVVLCSACDEQPPPPTASEGRLEAAKAISDPRTRNESLAKVAIDAIYADDVPTATKAIQSISEPNLSNRTASTCALALSKTQPKAAVDLANLISDPNLRNSSLQAIVQGQ